MFIFTTLWDRLVGFEILGFVVQRKGAELGSELKIRADNVRFVICGVGLGILAEGLEINVSLRGIYSGFKDLVSDSEFRV